MNKLQVPRNLLTPAALFWALAVLIAPAVARAAAVPALVNYQGRLTDSGGMPVNGASVPMVFSLWDGETAGTILWSEAQAVEVSGGIYSVMLGDSLGIGSLALSGSTVFLQVTVMGETLAPRQRLTSVPFAIEAGNADRLDSLDATDFAPYVHFHDFSELTGTATDAQIPDDISINQAKDSTMLNGRSADAYVLAAGDTVTGHLSVLGRLNAGNDLMVMDNLGIGTQPDNNYSIINSASTPPLVGAALYGSSEGFETRWTGSPSSNFVRLASSLYGIYASSGTDAFANSAVGGYFQSSSQANALGLYSNTFGYGASDAYGVYSTVYNFGSADAYGGYFAAYPGGTGTMYGIFASGGDYAGWFQDGRVHVGSGGTENYVAGNGDLYVQNTLEADGHVMVSGPNPALYAELNSSPASNHAWLASADKGVAGYAGSPSSGTVSYGGYFQGTSLGAAFGAYGLAYGYGANPVSGVQGFASNSSTGNAYGGYFTADAAGTGDHYGVYAQGDSFGLFALSSGRGVYGQGDTGVFGYGTTDGVYGMGDTGVYGAYAPDPAHYGRLGGRDYGVYGSATGVDSITSAKGGYFEVNNSLAIAYGVYIVSNAFSASTAYGLLADVHNYSTGNVIGAYLSASAVSGTSYGLLVPSGIKSWANPDPEDASQSIIYSTVESGENVTYFAGSARLANGRAVVVLPDHFRKVTSPDHRVVVQLTPRSTKTYGLAVIESTNQRIVVEELMDGKGNFEFDYTVKGIRRGYEDFQPITRNQDYVPFQGNLSGMDRSETTTQEYYDHQPPGLKKIFEQNGTLDKNGKVNEAAFRARGWKEVKQRAPRGEGPGK